LETRAEEAQRLMGRFEHDLTGWTRWSLRIPRDAEPDVRGRGVRCVRRSRGHSVPVAVGVVAEERTASHDPRPSRVGPARIDLWRAPIVVAVEVIGAPFPDVADCVEQYPAVGGEVSGRGGADEPVIEGVRVREVPLPDVAVPLPVDEQSIAPRVASSLESAAGGALPFGFA